MRRATATNNTPKHKKEFQSTLSMRRATMRMIDQILTQLISIHALHEESDFRSLAVVSIR